ncbi:hypothetical protein LOAG_17551 [Loa loa]|nr:hypothetical protein LOAG_17551 [Loa loa]EJD75269.1 hypothetical protein LOAG_17551 [Loa loa]
MCIFNVDRIHPTISHHTIIVANRNTQTDWCRMNQKIQIGVKMRHAAIQSKETQVKERTKHVTTKDAAVQLSKRISRQQLTEIIGEIINQILAANEKNQQLHKHSGNKLSVLRENSNRIKSGNQSQRKINLSKKSMSKGAEYFNNATYQRLPMLKLANLNGNYPKWNIGNRSRIINGSNQFRGQHNANIITNSSNSYNAICRRQLLHKLDQLIAQKMLTLQKMHMIKSAELKDKSKNSKQKIERLCRISANPSCRSHKRLLNTTLSSIDKNTANISTLNENWPLKGPINQNLIIPNKTISNNNSDKSSGYSNRSKLASSMTMESEYTSGSTTRNSIGKFKKHLVTEKRRNSDNTITESDSETSSDNDGTDIDSGDNNNADNHNRKSSTAYTVSSEFSSEASTITELPSIK